MPLHPGFQDLTAPVAELPITIVDVYDSRDKRVGDFGVGWRLDLQTLRLRANRVPRGRRGAGWDAGQSAGEWM